MTDPFLWETVNFLYHSVMDNMPQFLQDRPVFSAIVLGSAGSYGLVRSLQWFSNKYMDYFIPGFDKKWLPNLEKACIAGILSIPLAYSFLNPNEAKAIISEHPVYSAGMSAAAFSGIFGAWQDLSKRKINKTLEDYIISKILPKDIPIDEIKHHL